MPTGYDLIEHNHDFRVHLLKRLAASLIDVLIVFTPILLITYALGLESREILAGVLSGFAWFIYSAAMESRTGYTIGKKTMGLFVVSNDGPMTLSKGIVRNVPKMFWYIFLPLDLFVGMANDKDPRQRWVDGVAGTTVVISAHR